MRFFLRLALLALLASSATLSLSAQTLYVMPTPQGSQNGTSWANAATLDYALSVATPGTEILLFKGTYYPTQQFNVATGTVSTGNPRRRTFLIPDGVRLRGRQDTSTVGTFGETILSGDFNNDDNANKSENAYHVVTVLGTGSMMSFVQIQGGAATGQGEDAKGGAIYMHASAGDTVDFGLYHGCSASGIANDAGGCGYMKAEAGGVCGFGTVLSSFSGSAMNGGMWAALADSGECYLQLNTGNESGNASVSGGGVYCRSIHHGKCSFYHFRSDITASSNQKGGVYSFLAESSGTIDASITEMDTSIYGFGGGGSTGHGGLAYLDVKGGGTINFKMSDCKMKGFHATAGNGGAIAAVADGGTFSIDLMNVSIANSSATGNGGAVYCSSNTPGSKLILQRTAMQQNSAGGNGGGVYANGNIYTKISNSLFRDNGAINGGGVYANATHLHLFLNSIYHNTATTAGGGVYCSGSIPSEVASTAIWGSKAAGDSLTANANVTLVNGASLAPRYSYIEAITTPANHNLDGIAHAGDTAWMHLNAQLRPLTGSPFINAGDPTIGKALEYATYQYLTDSMDSDCSFRQRYGVFDLGAYEYWSCPSYDTVFVDWQASGANNGTSWADAYTTLDQALAADCPSPIWVAEGTYKPADTLAGRKASFALPCWATVQGGYAHASNLRDPALYPTILSGDLGIVGDSSDNAYHVVTCAGNQMPTTLDGLVITGGNANGTDSTLLNDYLIPNHLGGGIALGPVNLKIKSGIIARNTAQEGGGLYATGAWLPVNGSGVFTQNHADLGGGASLHNVNGQLNNLVCWGNTALYGAGVALSGDTTPEFRHVSVVGNHATLKGGGLWSTAAAPGALINSIFWENTVQDNGQPNDSMAGADLACAPGIPPFNRFWHTMFQTTDTTFLPADDSLARYNNLRGVDPMLKQAQAPRGADSLWLTADDQLMTLCGGSPAQNSGVPLGTYTTDILNVNRGSKVDRGAYEAEEPLDPLLHVYEKTIDCPGKPRLFTAFTAYTGPSYSLEWFFNDSLISTHPDTVTSPPMMPGDTIFCQLTITDSSQCIAKYTASDWRVPYFPTPLTPSISGLDTVYCAGSIPDTLAGVPAGGSFSGWQISGNKFNPVLAGSDTISYTVSDNYNCAYTVRQAVKVKTCTHLSEPLPTAGMRVRLWPNPTQTEVHLSVETDWPSSVEAEVLDARGARLQWQTLEQEALSQQLSFSFDTPGVYLIRVQTRAGQQSFRVVVE